MWEKLLKLDRRWIFLLVSLSVLVPLLRPLGLPMMITEPVYNLYTYIDTLKPKDKAVMLVTDFDPSTMPELLPMAEAIMRHCFAKKIPLILYGGMYPTYVGMAKMALSNVLPDFPDIKYGEDYVFLGYIPGTSLLILSMGESIPKTFGNDYYGNKLDTLPLMQRVKNYENVAIVVDLSGAGTPVLWIIYGYQRYGVRIGCGTTAVSAAQYYPYLHTGQFVGMLGGLKGAAEYETLIERAGIPCGRKSASIGMDAQSIVHLMLIFLIILGNVGFLIVRRKR